ncbi:MAG: TGS domain-containing protein [Eubacteriales bacterium]|nr:TGS domain-containing protein [Eubacteriales bacterium]
MRIELTADEGKLKRELDVPAGTSVEDIYKSVKQELKYECMAAKVNNEYRSLDFVLTGDACVELLDIRSVEGKYTYQNTLSLIYLTAVRDVLGDYRVIIDNSLNQGYFTVIHKPEGVNEEEVRKIELRMRELVERDLPVKHEMIGREEGLAILREMGRDQNIRLIKSMPELTELEFFDLEGYKDFFYGLMVPSTGYIKLFELRKYRMGVILRAPEGKDPDHMPDYREQPDLYQAFSEQKRWDKLLGVECVADLNDKIRNNGVTDLVMLSEALQQSKIVEAADRILESKARLVLIAGPSSSGKTTFAKRLCVQMKVKGHEAMYMGTDDYFLDRSEMTPGPDGKYNFEDLDAVDVKLFNKDLKTLLEGGKADIPVFNFLTGKKEFGSRITSIKKDQIIVIEGIHGLNEALTPEIPRDKKFKIYISPLTQLNMDEHNRIPTTDERMLRRMVRDNLFRGHDARITIDEWPMVRAGEEKNIFPYSKDADLLFNSYSDYEISVLKKYAEPLLKKVSPADKEYAEAIRFLNFLKYFEVIDDTSAVNADSIMREFIGGSIYVK